MAPDRNFRKRELIATVLECPRESLAHFLEKACGGDWALRSEVETLVASVDSTVAFTAIPATRAFRAGEMVGDRFRVVRFIGNGGMGEVYEAEDLHIGGHVALKTIRPEAAANERILARFRREIQLAKRVTHRNVCRIHDIGYHSSAESGQQVVFLSMELLAGETLSSRLRRGGMSDAEVTSIARDIAYGLAAAHQEQVIHRDFKPGNVILVGGSAPRAVITDFGLAQALNEPTAATQVGVIVGTPEYMAPEQLEGGSITCATDIYAFGLVLYEMVTGSKPFPGDRRASTLRRLVESPPPVRTLAPDVDAALEAMIVKCLEREPQRRYQSAEEVTAEFSHSRDTLRPFTQTPVPTIALPQGRKRRLRPATAYMAGIMCLLLLGAFLWFRSDALPADEASRWYEQGTRALRDGTYFNAMNAFDRCVQLDPNFALAHARLAEAANELDYGNKAKRELLRAAPALNSWLTSRLDRLRMQAIYAFIMKDYGRAAELYRELIGKAPRAEKPGLFIDLGRVYENAADLPRATAAYTESLKLDRQYAAPFLRLGQVLHKQQKLDLAATRFNEAEELYRATGNLEGLTEVIYQRGAMLNKGNNLSEAERVLQDALRLAGTTGSDYQQIRILLLLSNNAYTEGRTSDGQQRAEQAIDLARRKGIDVLAASGSVDFATALQIRGEYERAEAYFRAAVDLAKRSESPRVEARAANALGGLLLARGHTDEGLALTQNAADYYIRNGYRYEAARALIAVGRAQRDKGDYAAAERIFRHDLELAAEIRNERVRTLAEHALGTVLLREEKYRDALDHFDQALSANRVASDRVTAPYLALDRARALTGLGRLGEAEQAVNELMPTGNLSAPLIGDIHEVRARIALARTNWKAVQEHARASLAADEGDNRDRATEMLAMAALANAVRGGRSSAPCALAVGDGLDDRDPALRVRVMLLLARCELARRRYSDAQAAGARVNLDPLGKVVPDSSFQALAVQASAAFQGGDRQLSVTHAAAALARLQAIQRAYPADFETYAARPDIAAMIRQTRVIQ